MRWLSELSESGTDLRALREAAFALLGEDQLALPEHVELPFRALFDLGLVLGLGVQLDRETRGPRVVAVSDGAVLDEDARHAVNATDSSWGQTPLRLRGSDPAPKVSELRDGSDSFRPQSA
jgi:hypothetical protein